MPHYSKISGVWRETGKSHEKADGVWRIADKVYDKIAGVWRESYSAGVPLLQLPDGANAVQIKLTESAGQQPFIVLKHNYEDSGRTLVLRQGLLPSTSRYNASTINNRFDGSDIDTAMTTYYNALPAALKNLIFLTTIPCTVGGTGGGGDKEVAYYARRVFPLSCAEVGFFGEYANIEGSPLAYFNSAARRQAGAEWWLRSPNPTNRAGANAVIVSGGWAATGVSGYKSVRPAFTLPAGILFDPTPNGDGYYIPLQ